MLVRPHFLLFRIAVAAATLLTSVSAGLDRAMGTETDSDISVPAFMGQPSVQTNPINLSVNGTRFTIPRNYVESAYVRRGGVFVRIVASFPDFNGAGQDNIDQFKLQNWAKSPNIIWIANVTTSVFGESSKKTIQILGEGGDRDTKLDLFHTKDDPKYSTKDIYFNTRDPSNPEIFVAECSTLKGSNNRCQVYFDFKTDLTFEYELDRSLLAHWRAVDKGIRDLLSQFTR